MMGGLGAKFSKIVLRKRTARGWFVALRPRGFTIIEVMIVLAVTGALFVSAAVLIAGRQRQTEFNQSIRQIQSQIQQVINEVSIGFYPNLGNFSCEAGAGGPRLTAVAAGQGTNSGCIFIGKAIQFDVADTDPEEFRVLTIAGLQKNDSGQEVATYAQAAPTVVAPSTSDLSRPDGSVDETLQYGLTTHEMFYGATKTNIGAVVFANSLAQFSEGSIVSGSQHVNIIPVNGTALDSTPPQAAEAINNRFTTSPINTSGGVSICFVSAGTNQSGLIKIGGVGRQLSVTLDIKSNKTCS